MTSGEIRRRSFSLALALASATSMVAVGEPQGQPTVVASPSAVTISISPRRTPVTLKQKQQFKATVLNTSNTAVKWSVDGITGGTATVGTISTSGRYTPPGTRGTHSVKVTSMGDPTKSASAKVWVTDYPGMFTHHGERFRSGLNAQELALSPSLVNPTNFGKLFSRTVDGQVYAQPLYVANLFIAGAFHNVVYVATEHDTVYAFDADGIITTPFWRHSFINPPAVITIQKTDPKSLIFPEVGITGTPVIDPVTKTLYVVASTQENSTFVHRLHALSLTTGAEKFGGPVRIQGSVAGTYPALAQNGVLPFVPSKHLQRPALLLVNGVVYIAFGSNGDIIPYNGWLFAYTANSTGILHRVGIMCTSPNQGLSAIWQSGGGPAADSDGNVFLVTANGTFNLNIGGSDAGDTFLKLHLQSGAFSRLDYFTPHNQTILDENDYDLGSGGPMIAPFQSGAVHPRLVIAGGKEGVIYLVDRDNMGKFHASSDQVVQKIVLGSPFPQSGVFFAPATWNGFVYFGAVNDSLKAFRFSVGLLSNSPVAQSTTIFSYPGTTPSVSANGSVNGIVWALQTDHYVGGVPEGGVNPPGQAVLRAYRASDLSQLYNSSQAGTRDLPGIAIKYTVPTVANGRVYVGTATQSATGKFDDGRLTVYGFLP